LPLRFQSERRFERSGARHNQPQEVVRVDTNTAVEASGQKPGDRALTGALRAVNEEDRSLRSSSQRKSKLYTIELKGYVTGARAFLRSEWNAPIQDDGLARESPICGQKR
jgi:hypothetical protein